MTNSRTIHDCEELQGIATLLWNPVLLVNSYPVSVLVKETSWNKPKLTIHIGVIETICILKERNKKTTLHYCTVAMYSVHFMGRGHWYTFFNSRGLTHRTVTEQRNGHSQRYSWANGNLAKYFLWCLCAAFDWVFTLYFPEVISIACNFSL